MIDGIEIGPSVGSCGTAADFGHAIVVTDIERDPLWSNFKELALRYGLRSCWSTPFMARDREVLGTVALYYREPRGPTERDRDIVRLIGATAGLVVENARLAVQLARWQLRSGGSVSKCSNTSAPRRVTRSPATRWQDFHPSIQQHVS